MLTKVRHAPPQVTASSLLFYKSETGEELTHSLSDTCAERICSPRWFFRQTIHLHKYASRKIIAQQDESNKVAAVEAEGLQPQRYNQVLALVASLVYASRRVLRNGGCPPEHQERDNSQDPGPNDLAAEFIIKSSETFPVLASIEHQPDKG
jgi:hypothetical protein